MKIKIFLLLMFFIESPSIFINVSGLKCYHSTSLSCDMPQSVECSLKDFDTPPSGGRKRRSLKDLQDDYDAEMSSIFEQKGLLFLDLLNNNGSSSAGRGRYIEDHPKSISDPNYRDYFLEYSDKAEMIIGNGNNKTDQWGCFKLTFNGQFNLRSCYPLNLTKNVHESDVCSHRKRPILLPVGGTSLAVNFTSSSCFCFTDNCNTATYAKKSNHLTLAMLVFLGQIGFSFLSMSAFDFYNFIL